MALMLTSLYRALLKAGADEETASKAAEEVAAYESSIGGIKLVVEGLRTEIRVVQAIQALLVVVTFAMLWQIFAIRGDLAGIETHLDSIKVQISEEIRAAPSR